MSSKLGKEMISLRNELASQVSEKLLTKDEAIQSLAVWLLKRNDFPQGQITHGLSIQENALLNAQAAFDGIL